MVQASIAAHEVCLHPEGFDWDCLVARAGAVDKPVAGRSPLRYYRLIELGALVVTTVQIDLPDSLAKEAAQAGLLTAEVMERLLREAMRQRAEKPSSCMRRLG